MVFTTTFKLFSRLSRGPDIIIIIIVNQVSYLNNKSQAKFVGDKFMFYLLHNFLLIFYLCLAFFAWTMEGVADFKYLVPITFANFIKFTIPCSHFMLLSIFFKP